jgi:hypothetical protein
VRRYDSKELKKKGEEANMISCTCFFICICCFLSFSLSSFASPHLLNFLILNPNVFLSHSFLFLSLSLSLSPFHSVFHWIWNGQSFLNSEYCWVEILSYTSLSTSSSSSLSISSIVLLYRGEKESEWLYMLFSIEIYTFLGCLVFGYFEAHIGRSSSINWMLRGRKIEFGKGK